MKISLIFSSLVILGLANVAVAQDTSSSLHPKIAEALAWQMPAHECGPAPKNFIQNKKTNDDTGLDLTVSDVDYYTQKRMKRKTNRWEKCIDGYKSNLKQDFGTLKDSAQYGLTQVQANQIMAKMKTIQWALMSKDAVPREPVAADS